VGFLAGSSLCRIFVPLGTALPGIVSGEMAEAKSAYEDFLRLWKDACGDIPVLKQAIAIPE
jgi:hypothetical protein